MSGRYPKRNGNRSPNSSPRNSYRTSDDKWLAVSASTPPMAKKLFATLDLAYLLEDSRFSSNEARLKHADETDEVIANAIGKLTMKEVMARFDAAEVAGSPIYEVSDFVADPHVKARNVLVEVDDADIGNYHMHAPVPQCITGID